MDIKTFKKYFKKIHLDYWIATIVLSLFALYLTFSYLRALRSGIPTEYSSYQNVQVQVQEATMNGKLNQYITIKQRHKNKYCYVPYCGFPKEGHYHLSHIEFIDIDGDVFILKSCLNKEECFYNISESFIKKIKEDKFQTLKGLVFFLYIMICLNLIMGMDNARERCEN